VSRFLILGYGNPLRCDDGVGWRAAWELAGSLSDDEAEVVGCHQLTPELAEAVSRAEAVFFIDASHEGEPGELRCQPVEPQAETIRFSHQLTPELLLNLSRVLYGTCPPAFVVSVCGQRFEHGQELSPVVAANLPRLTMLVSEMMRQRTSPPRPA